VVCICTEHVACTDAIAANGIKRPITISCDSAFTLAVEIQSRVAYLKALRESVSAGFHETRDEMGQTELHCAVAGKSLKHGTRL
jgi:hypothetical protein